MIANFLNSVNCSLPPVKHKTLLYGLVSTSYILIYIQNYDLINKQKTIKMKTIIQELINNYKNNLQVYENITYINPKDLVCVIVVN